MLLRLLTPALLLVLLMFIIFYSLVTVQVIIILYKYKLNACLMAQSTDNFCLMVLVLSVSGFSIKSACIKYKLFFQFLLLLLMIPFVRFLLLFTFTLAMWFSFCLCFLFSHHFHSVNQPRLTMANLQKITSKKIKGN